MQITQEENQIKDLIKNAKSVAVFVPESLGKDALASACALSEVIKNQEKTVKIYYSGTDSSLPIFKKLFVIENEITEAELVISFEYKDTPIERVGYSTDDGVFQMKISPVERSFDQSKISYNFLGPRLDLIITIGATSLEQLGGLYSKNPEIFTNAPIINIDNKAENTLFGVVNLVVPEAKSLSQLMFFKFGLWGYLLPNNAIEAILIGLRQDVS
jgi:nanoRNase/pAp phosphatase (c-di-AMP/oligoRNAs hydrolase)